MIACDGYESALCPARRQVEEAEAQVVYERERCLNNTLCWEEEVKALKAANAEIVKAAVAETKAERAYREWMPGTSRWVEARCRLCDARVARRKAVRAKAKP